MGSAAKDTNPKHPDKERAKSEEEKLDEALDDTFPASDPPSMTAPHRHEGSGNKSHHGSTKEHHSGRR